MQIKTIYKPGVIDAAPQESIADVAARMRENDVSAIAVIEADQLLGIITERDLIQALADGAHPSTSLVESYMTPEPFTVGLEEDSGEVAMQMLERGVRHVPVVFGGRVVGIVSSRDLLMLEAMASAGAR